MGCTAITSWRHGSSKSIDLAFSEAGGANGTAGDVLNEAEGYYTIPYTGV